jgi:hypothetical protein
MNTASVDSTQAVDPTSKLSCTSHIRSCVRGTLATNPAIPFRAGYGDYHPDALRAFEIHRQRAEAMGQVWSVDHANAFRELHNAYVLTAKGIHRGRAAWPLAVGTGKTQSLVAFACVQAQRARIGREPLSLLICIERVDQGRDLYMEMINAGVPAEMLGVYHRKTPREVADEGLIPSVSEADACAVPFLIATHAMMLKGEDFIAKVNTYKGRERSLVVWDESLIKSQGRHFDLARVEGAAGVLRSAVIDTQSDAFKDARDAAAYIESCTSRLREEFTKGLAGVRALWNSLSTCNARSEWFRSWSVVGRSAWFTTSRGFLSRCRASSSSTLRTTFAG